VRSASGPPRIAAGVLPINEGLWAPAGTGLRPCRPLSVHLRQYSGNNRTPAFIGNSPAITLPS
jgi:hypothetical protein